MRLLYFRGKDINTGQWVYGHYYYCISDNAHKIVVTTTAPADVKNLNPEETYQTEVFIDPNTIGQHIGIEDGIPVGIFEGDIVHCWDEDTNGGNGAFANIFKTAALTGVVNYREGRWCVGTNHMALFSAENIAIEGNYWDTPDIIPESDKEFFRA